MRCARAVELLIKWSPPYSTHARQNPDECRFSRQWSVLKRDEKAAALLSLLIWSLRQCAHKVQPFPLFKMRFYSHERESHAKEW